MKLPEIFNQLVRGYQKVKGVEPKGLDLIKIKQEAMSRFKDMNKVVDMEGKSIDTSKGIMGGKQLKAMGGRAGFKDGEGIMQMASNDMNERLLEKLFEDLLEQGLSPEEAEIKAREMLNEMGDTSSIPDRGAQSITLADGGRAEFKDGLLAKLMPSVKPDGGLFKSIFANRNAPFLSGFNTAELFDIVSQISSLPGLADGGRIGYKDGPKDPRRRTFMKAAAGIASMIPLGGAKIIGKAAPVVAKAAEISGPALAKIVDTVMSLGKLISVKGRRVKEMVTKKKHEGVEVTEDIQDGSYIIKKGDKEIYYKPGRQDEMGIDDDIIEVIEKTVTKKAGGGVARLLGE